MDSILPPPPSNQRRFVQSSWSNHAGILKATPKGQRPVSQDRGEMRRYWHREGTETLKTNMLLTEKEMIFRKKSFATQMMHRKKNSVWSASFVVIFTISNRSYYMFWLLFWKEKTFNEILIYGFNSRLQQDKMCWSSATNSVLEVEQRVKREGDLLMFVFMYSRTIVQINSCRDSLTELCP